jgi:hypothetical protein
MYKSVREAFSAKDYYFMEYEGTIHGVINRLTTLASSSEKFASFHDLDAADLILHPARIVRGLLDLRHEDALEQAFEIGIAMSGGEIPLEKLKSLREIVPDGPVTEILDLTSWKYGRPKLSYASAKAIFDDPRREGEDVLLVSIAHGSTRAAFDVCGKYRDLARRTDAMVLDAIRFSRHKMQEERPYISPTTASRILEKAKDRCVVVFDEDMYEGYTVLNMTAALKDLLQKDIFVQVNYINGLSR